MTEEVFSRGMMRLSVLYLNAEKVGADLLLIYHQALDDLTDWQFIEAVRLWERTQKWMPKPSELREIAPPEPDDGPPDPPPFVMGVPLPEYLRFARGEAPRPKLLEETNDSRPRRKKR